MAGLRGGRGSPPPPPPPPPPRGPAAAPGAAPPPAPPRARPNALSPRKNSSCKRFESGLPCPDGPGILGHSTNRRPAHRELARGGTTLGRPAGPVRLPLLHRGPPRGDPPVRRRDARGADPRPGDRAPRGGGPSREGHRVRAIGGARACRAFLALHHRGPARRAGADDPVQR